MKSPKYLVCSGILVLLTVFTLSYRCLAAEEKYDIVYMWDTDLESVLDYEDELAKIFDNSISQHLEIVGRGNEYGVVYDTNGSAAFVAQELARQGEILRKASLAEGWAIKDQGYHKLYNVSYGLGPHLDALKKKYTHLYSYLGKEVGKNLFIEKTDSGNYTLIYRRCGDRESTLVVARRHARLLRRKGIHTTITPEDNYDVVYGESSLLDDSDDQADGQTQQVARKIPTPVSIKAQVHKQQVASEVVKLTPLETKTIVASIPVTESASSFEKDIQELINQLRQQGKIRGDEKTGWMVYDLESNTPLVDINANQRFQSASMIKPFVALAFFHQVKAGKLVYGPRSRRKMEAMIQRSSNSAADWIMRRVGGPDACNGILHRYYSDIFKNTVIQEYIPANGRTYKNSAQPSDYIRFLRALWHKKLPYSRELRRVMALPGRDRLYYGTPIPQGTLVYNKTGTTAHLCGDMGILVPKTIHGRRHPYAIVGIIERSSRPADYSRWMLTRGAVIRKVSTLVYESLKKKFHLI